MVHSVYFKMALRKHSGRQCSKGCYDNTKAPPTNHSHQKVVIVALEDVGCLFVPGDLSGPHSSHMRLSETRRLDLRAIESVTETLKKSFDVEGFEKSAAVPYVFGDGYRRVPPYYHTYATNCKERWRGRTLLDVFSKEFRDRDELYYVRVEHDGSTNLQRTAINTGLVNINNKAANIDTLLNNGDVIRHRIHRHEPPVNPKAIEVLHESVDGLVVIDKPAGIPVSMLHVSTDSQGSSSRKI